MFIPTAVAAAFLSAIVGVVLDASTNRSDALAIERQTRLIETGLEKDIAQIANDQEASTLWNDAVVRLRERSYDTTWLDNNLGVWFYSYYQHDETYVLDPAMHPIYAMQKGRRVNPQAFFHVARQALPLANALREDLEDGYWSENDGHGQTIGALDTVVVDRRPAIISIKPIVPESDAVQMTPGSEYLHVSVRYLDGNFLAGLSDRLQITDPRFSWEPGERASLPLTDRAGTVVGYFRWEPFTPGSQVAQSMIPTLVVSLLLVATVLATLLIRVFHGRIDLEASRAHAQHLAFHDALTGLPNRALFDDRLAGATARGRRSGTVALLLIDLDRFKHVNDTLGHQAGDALICEFALRLSSIARQCDTVARLGGDEFAIVIEQCSQEDLGHVCQRILREVARPFHLPEGQAFVGASIGVAISTDGSDDAAELIRKADIALYRVKAGGRQNYSIFSAEMDEFVKWRSSIEEEFRRSLATGKGLSLHYQPLVESENLSIVGVEALVRWEHPRLGSVAPDRFIAVAEETGLIDELGDWVLRRAAQASLKWPELFVAVNLAPSQFHDEDFGDRVLAIVQEAGADPARFQIEVTERVLLDDGAGVQATLAHLRYAGFQIALDDFGTGYSSLSYLQRFKVDKIKIDRSFVQYLGQRDDSSQIITAILALGKAMGLTVTAEGVETQTQLDLLVAAGCCEMQGFLFAPALTESEITRSLELERSGPRALSA